MKDKNKYTLTSYRDNKTEHPTFIELEDKIKINDLITFYYYLLYPNLNYAGETHNYYELFICLGGKAKVCVENETFYLNEKQFIITAPNKRHIHLPEKTFLSSVSISFSADGLDDNLICNKVANIDENELGFVNVLINEYINNYEYQGEYEQPYVKKVDLKNEFAYKQVFKCSLEILLIFITRKFQHDESVQKVDIIKEQKENENEVVRYIKEHYKDKLLLDDIAKNFNYSVGHLCRKFKKDTGDTVIDYITKYRISIAMKLLFEKRNLNIEEIAFESGFNDVQYFTKSFKKCVGMTPGKYRSEVIKTNAIHAQDVMFDVIKNIN